MTTPFYVYNISTPNGVDFSIIVRGNMLRIRSNQWKPISIEMPEDEYIAEIALERDDLYDSKGKVFLKEAADNLLKCIYNL